MQFGEVAALVGRKRFIFLVVLLIGNAILVGAWQKILLPQSQKLTAEKSTATSEKLRIQQEIYDLPAKYEQMKKDEARYDVLLTSGFMAPQDRIQASQKLNDMRAATGLRGIDYSLEPQKKVESNDYYTLTYDVVFSTLDVKFKALTDIEIRNFIEKLRNSFSGLVVVKNIKLERKGELTEAALVSLGKNEPVDFIEGEVKVDWYSMLPKPADGSATNGQAFQGAQQ